MAKALLVPLNGAVVIGSLVADFMHFDISSTMDVSDATPYGSNVNTVNVGSGTAGFTMDVGAACQAHATNTPFLMPTMGSSTAAGASAGQSAVFTLDTGVTETCSVVMKSIRISHARMKGVVLASLSMVNAGDVVEAWAST